MGEEIVELHSGHGSAHRLRYRPALGNKPFAFRRTQKTCFVHAPGTEMAEAHSANHFRVQKIVPLMGHVPIWRYSVRAGSLLGPDHARVLST